MMARVTHLASETSSGRSVKDALKAPRMLALMPVL
jgi:hypothetical protein